MSGVTDCYQPAERRFRITRGCLEVLAEFRNPVSIVTKNQLVARDADLLGELARFPFPEPADGDFRLSGRVTGAMLDVYPGPMDGAGGPAEPGAIWPVLSEIDAELVFERHHQFDRVEGIGTEVGDEGLFVRHVGFGNAELFGNARSHRQRVIGMATALVGLVVVVPWLAHASWHAYRALVAPVGDAPHP